MLERATPSPPSGPASAQTPRRSPGGPCGRHSSLRRCTGAVLSCASWTLLVSYIGRRTTTSTLLLLPPAHFLALALCTRLAALCAPRVRRHVDASAAGWAGWAGWTSASAARPAALLAVAAVGEVVAVGQLELEVACAVQTLLPPAILLASSRFGPPSSLSSALSPATVAACVAPLLLVTSSLALSTGAVPLACGLVAVGARAGAWLVLADGAASTPFQVAWSAAPVATVITSAVALANLAVRQSPSAALYPLPSMLLFVLAASILHLVALATTLAGRLHSANQRPDRDDLPKSALATVPVALVVLVAARIGGVELPAFATSCAAAALGTVVVAWAAAAARPPSEADDEWAEAPRVRVSLRGGRTPPLGPSPRSHSPPRGDARSSRSTTFLAVLPFLPALVLLAQALVGRPLLALPTLPLHRLDPYYANRLGLFDHTSSPSTSSAAFSPATLDVVFAYYDSPVDEFAAHVAETLARSSVRKFRTRVSVYDKGGGGGGGGAGGEARGEETRRELGAIEGVDEVVQLENVGREGGTYLHHILRRFDAPTAADRAFLGPDAHDRPTSHADMTLFLQHHLAWAWVGAPRFDHLDARTGFMSLGPYVKSDCGVDQRVWGDFRRMRELYSMFREDLCPPTLQLASWAAQFFVSRARIVANPRTKYARVKELLEAPLGHWLEGEGASFDWGGDMGPSNPFFGHALERSWPVIFNCTDPGVADRCGDDVYDKDACQCRD